MDFKKFIKIIPFILGLLIIPVAMRMVPVTIPYDVQLHWNGSIIDYDIFSYSKSVLLIITGVIVAIMLFFMTNGETFARIKSLKAFAIAMGILLFMAIISTVLGGNMVISLGGAPSRYEGLYTYIAYFLLFFYAFSIEYDEKIEKAIIIIMAIFTVLCFIVGLSQYTNNNIFLKDFGKMLYIPEKLSHLADSMTEDKFTFDTMYIFTTHYNYSSMLMSMLSMFWLIYCICTKNGFNLVLSGIMFVASAFMLMGANARSGIIAVIISFIILLLTFIPKILTNKKVSIVSFIILVVIIGGALKLGMMSRVSSLIDDIMSISTSSQQGDEHIRKEVPVKDIFTDDKIYKIVYTDEIEKTENTENSTSNDKEYKEITLKFDKSTNSFYDENDNVLVFDTLEQGKVTFKDERYTNWVVETSQRKSNIDETNHLYHIVRITPSIYFNFDVTENVTLVNHLGLPIYPEKAERIGFSGMERLGSGRMFIISSTLPIIKKSPLIGYGPDSFLMLFNQDDVYAKMYVYGEPNHIVDKPHNLYLLFAVNFGIIGLLAFLYMMILLIIRAMKKYKRSSVSKDALYIAAFAGVLAYMGSGFFNDSTVSVSPIFWLLFGISVSGIGAKKINNK